MKEIIDTEKRQKHNGHPKGSEKGNDTKNDQQENSNSVSNSDKKYQRGTASQMEIEF